MQLELNRPFGSSSSFISRRGGGGRRLAGSDVRPRPDRTQGRAGATSPVFVSTLRTVRRIVENQGGFFPPKSLLTCEQSSKIFPYSLHFVGRDPGQCATSCGGRWASASTVRWRNACGAFPSRTGPRARGDEHVFGCAGQDSDLSGVRTSHMIWVSRGSCRGSCVSHNLPQ
jgi:hypothetical protein